MPILSPHFQYLCITEWMLDSGLLDVMLCCWLKCSYCFEGICHLHIYGFIAHDMFLQHIRDCLPSNILSYLKIQNPGLYHHAALKKHTMDLIQKLQQSILCSVNCIMFIYFVEAGVSDIRETRFTVCGEKEHQPLQQARPFQYSNTPYHR